MRLPLPQFFDLFFRQIFQFIASKQLECFLEFSDLLLCQLICHPLLLQESNYSLSTAFLWELEP